MFSGCNQQKNIGSLCKVRRGTTITRKETVNGDIPVIAGGLKPSCYHNASNRKGDVITVSGSGANAGFVSYWPSPIFASDCNTIEPLKDNILMLFVYYQLHFRQKEMYALQPEGAGQPHVYGDDIEKVQILYDNIEQQQKFVAYASKYDKLKFDETKIIIGSEKSKFDELFGRKNNNGCILDFGYVGTGTTPSMKNSDFYANKDIPFIKPSDLDDVNCIMTSEFYIDESARSVARIFPAGTVLVSCIGTIGKIGITVFEASCNQQINYIIPNKNTMSRYIAYEVRKKILPMIEEISQIKMTVAIINKNNFEKIKVYIPNDEEINEFNDFIENVDKLKFFLVILKILV